MAAGTHHAKHIPILGKDGFRFPNKDFGKENHNAMISVTSDPAALEVLIADVFKTIAIVFEPQSYSSTEEVLAAKADAVAERCMKPSLLKELTFTASQFRQI